MTPQVRLKAASVCSSNNVVAIGDDVKILLVDV
jgi:hypothetical protein